MIKLNHKVLDIDLLITEGEIMTRLSFFMILTLFLAANTSCGCPRQAGMPYGPKVTGDGTGGTIAIYEGKKAITSMISIFRR